MASMGLPKPPPNGKEVVQPPLGWPIWPRGFFFFPLFLYNYNFFLKKKIIKDIFVLRGDIDILLVE
jgi:hypothetical protein